MYVAAGIVVGAAVTAGAGYYSSKQAAKAQKEGAKEAAEIQWKMYQQTRKDQMPWLEAGERALGTLEQRMIEGPGSFQESEYAKMLSSAAEDAYRRSQRAYNAAGAVGGRSARGTSAAVADITNQYYGNWLQDWMMRNNLLQSTAGLGQTTASNLGSSGSAAAGNIGAARMEAGQAAATGYINQANAIAGGVQSGLNLAAAYYGNQPSTTTSQQSAYGPYSSGYKYPPEPIYNPSY